MGGRPKGSKNKFNAKIQEAVEQAFDEVGGVDYLKKLAWTDKAVFVGLIAKMLPKDISVDVGDRLGEILDGIKSKKEKPE